MAFRIQRHPAGKALAAEACELLKRVYVGEAFTQPEEADRAFEGAALAARGTAWIAVAEETGKPLGTIRAAGSAPRGFSRTVACPPPSRRTASVDVKNAVYPAPRARNFTCSSAWPSFASKTSGHASGTGGARGADEIAPWPALDKAASAITRLAVTARPASHASAPPAVSRC